MSVISGVALLRGFINTEFNYSRFGARYDVALIRSSPCTTTFNLLVPRQLRRDAIQKCYPGFVMTPDPSHKAFRPPAHSRTKYPIKINYPVPRPLPIVPTSISSTLVRWKFVYTRIGSDRHRPGIREMRYLPSVITAFQCDFSLFFWAKNPPECF